MGVGANPLVEVEKDDVREEGHPKSVDGVVNPQNQIPNMNFSLVNALWKYIVSQFQVVQDHFGGMVCELSK